MRLLQLSVRRKIIVVVVSLSLAILAFASFVSFRALQNAREQLRLASGRDGRIAKTFLERFKGQVDASGAGDFAAASLIASDPDVVRSLRARQGEATTNAGGDDTTEAVDKPAKDKGDKDGDKKDDKGDKKHEAPAPEPGSAKGTADRKLVAALDRISETLAGTLDPELFLVLDSQNEPIRAAGTSKLSAGALRESRLVQDLRAGTLVRAKYALLDGVPYVVSGARIQDGKNLLGVVVLGKRVQTFAMKYALAQGGSTTEKQQRVSFLKGKTILGSALPKDDWGPFAAEATRETHPEVVDGLTSIPILVVGDGEYDFFDSDVKGYDGAGDPAAEIGKLLLVRGRESRNAEFSQAGGQIIWYFAGAALVAILVGVWLARHIVRPIDRYIEATQGLADGQGDLTKRLEVEADDELGRLAKNLNRVFEQIQGLAGRVQKTAFRVGDSSTQLSASSRTMLDGAKTQAVKIENSTAAVTELSASIQQVAENAGEATKVAQKSGAAAEDAIHRLEQIRRTVEEAGARIQALGESGKRIGSIVEVIRHISEQTTLLALNAAIEAAHAGEQGRGFAVVADEVSNLAKRVGRSARDIEDLIATIRDQTSEAVRAMQVGTREVEEGTNLVTNTLADLKTLIGVVEDTATAVSEQAIASDEIARNMDAVRTIAREVLSSSERAVTEGAELTQLAHLLDESVKGFKIDASRLSDDPPPRQLPPKA